MSYWTENDDKLGRAEESAYIMRFLTQQVSNRIARGKTGSYVLNIDATWGEGKSFFMKGLFADLRETRHPVIMIDAWRDDFSNDPLTAVVAEFDNFLKSFKSANRTIKSRVRTAGRELRRNIGKLTLLSARGIAKRATTYVVGEAADEVAQTAKELVSGDVDAIVGDASGAIIKFTDAKIDKFAEAKLAQFSEAKASLDNFQISLKKAVEALTANEFKPPFFVLVDELDRCRPTYAIEMLERIKHLFEVHNVVFVLATDTTQLSNSIKAVYGSEFDSRHYLARFFDRSYMLAAPNRFEMVKYLIENSGIEESKKTMSLPISEASYITAISKQFDLEVRQIQKAIDLLSVVCTTWDEFVPVEVVLIFPMIVAFLKGNTLDTDKLRLEVFTVEWSKNNYSPRVVENHDIREIFTTINGFRDRPLSEAIKEKRAIASANQWQSKSTSIQAAYDVLERECTAYRGKKRRPLLTSYSSRIRMAGRFIVSELEEAV